MCKAWIHAIRRDVGRYFHIVPGSTKVCSIHFRDEDFRQPSASTSARRRAKWKKGDKVATRTPYGDFFGPGRYPAFSPVFQKDLLVKSENLPWIEVSHRFPVQMICQASVTARMTKLRRRSHQKKKKRSMIKRQEKHFWLRRLLRCRKIMLGSRLKCTVDKACVLC